MMRRRVRVDHSQQRDPVPTGRQALGHCKHNLTTERVTNKKVGTVTLQGPDRVKIVLGHIFDALKRFAATTGTSGLQPIDGLLCLDAPGERNEIDYAAT